MRLSQEKELAQSIWFEKAKTPLGGYAEDFSRYKDATYFKEDPFLIPLFIEKLFPERFFSIKTEGAKPVFDDRMFVLCWYGNDSFAKKLSENREYLKDGWWYRFVFVDGSTKTCQNDEMIEEQLKKSVNPRWSGYRTFYGASRYSFVCLTDTLKTLKTNDAEFIVHHFQTIYYKMVELVLLQRACLLHFSDKVTDISSKLGGDETTLNQDVNVLYQEYIRFVNKIYFREITAQEQGIELYNLLQTQMGIAENVAALDNEIKELHDYVSLKEDRKRNELDNERNKLESQRNDRIEWLTKITTAFGIAGLIMAFFGMNYFGKETFVFWNTGGGIDFSVITTVVGIGFIVSVVSYFTYNKIINHMINKFKK